MKMRLVSCVSLVITTLGVAPTVALAPSATSSSLPRAYSGDVQLTVDFGTLTVPAPGGQASVTIDKTTQVSVSAEPDKTVPGTSLIQARFTPMPVETFPQITGRGSGRALGAGQVAASAAPTVMSTSPSTVAIDGSETSAAGGSRAEEPLTPTVSKIGAALNTPERQAISAAYNALKGVSGEAAGMSAVTAALDPGATKVPAPGTKIPVIVVHGFMSSGLVSLPTVLELKADGIDARTFTYGKYPWSLPGLLGVGGLAPIEDSAAELAAEVAKVKYETGSSKVNLVGGSEGGMVIREFMNHDTQNSVANVVEYSGAHNGTTLLGLGPLLRKLPQPLLSGVIAATKLLLGPAGEQLTTGSTFLDKVDKYPATKPGVNYLQFSNAGDFVVSPYTSSFRQAGPGSTVVNIETHSVPGSLPLLRDVHSLSLMDPATNKIVANFLKNSDANVPTAEQIANNPGTTITIDDGTATVAKGSQTATRITGLTPPSRPLPFLKNLGLPTAEVTKSAESEAGAKRQITQAPSTDTPRDEPVNTAGTSKLADLAGTKTPQSLDSPNGASSSTRSGIRNEKATSAGSKHIPSSDPAVGQTSTNTPSSEAGVEAAKPNTKAEKPRENEGGAPTNGKAVPAAGSASKANASTGSSTPGTSPSSTKKSARTQSSGPEASNMGNSIHDSGAAANRPVKTTPHGGESGSPSKAVPAAGSASKANASTGSSTPGTSPSSTKKSVGTGSTSTSKSSESHSKSSPAAD